MVIAVIGILAAMLLPAVSHAKISGQRTKAKLEIGQIVTAIQQYESAYNRYPVGSPDVLNAAANAAGGATDFTFGGPLPLPSPAGATLDVSTKAGTNNAEVIAILMDMEKYPNQVVTVNSGHARNPNQTKFLNATLVNDSVSSGVGTDGVVPGPVGESIHYHAGFE